MRYSCEPAHAHAEGIDAYTVSLQSPTQSISRNWKRHLVACSGNSETATDAEREVCHLQGDDRESLVSAFCEIGKRLITVRRTS